MLLLSDEILSAITEGLSNSTEDVNIISAYCKLSALKYLDSFINSKVRKRLLVRFLPSDILAGSTDKEIYQFCKQNGWELYFDFSLHAKTYIFDKIKCVVGSANATNNGLNIYSVGNSEAASYFELSDSDYNKTLLLYKNSNKLTEDLFNKIVEDISITDEEIRNTFRHKVTIDNLSCLMPEDFPSHNGDAVELYSSKAFKWLKSYLRRKDDQSAFFGEITAALHDIYIEDPRPLRKNVKTHLADLLNCIENVGVDEVKIERPNYSQKVILIKN